MKRLFSFVNPFRQHPVMATKWYVNAKSSTRDSIEHTSDPRNGESVTGIWSALEIHNCSSDTNEARVLDHIGVNPVINLVGVSGGKVWHSM
jgi:hypothetical protein